MALGDAIEVESGSYTPESLRLRRRLAESMLQQGTQSGPIGHWSQGLNRIVQAMLGGHQLGELERKEQDQQKASNDALLGLLGPGQAGGVPAVVPAMESPPAPSLGDQGASLGGAAAAAAVDPNIAPFAGAIASIESASEKNPYGAVGPATHTGDRAYGKYQVMGANVPAWTQEILGKKMTPQEFLANPQAQEDVFKTKYGQYLKETGSPQDAASMWFTGKPLAQGANRRARNPDGTPLGITGQQYVDKFTAALPSQGGQPSPVPAPAAVMPASAPVAPTRAPQAAAGTLTEEQIVQEGWRRLGPRAPLVLSGIKSQNPEVKATASAMLRATVQAVRAEQPKPVTPMDQLEMANKQATLEKTRADTAKVQSESREGDLKASGAKIEDTYKLQDAISGIDRSFKLTNDLINHPGLGGIAGRPFGGEVGFRGTGVNLADITPGTAQADAFNKHKTLVSNVALRTMEQLKATSAQGATGFGALSEKELQVLQDAAGNLRLSSSEDELTDSYREFQKQLLGVRERMVDRYHSKYGSDGDLGILSKQELIDAATGKVLDKTAAGKPTVRPQQLGGFDIPFTSTDGTAAPALPATESGAEPMDAQITQWLNQNVMAPLKGGNLSPAERQEALIRAMQQMGGY